MMLFAVETRYLLLRQRRFVTCDSTLGRTQCKLLFELIQHVDASRWSYFDVIINYMCLKDWLKEKKTDFLTYLEPRRNVWFDLSMFGDTSLRDICLHPNTLTIEFHW